MAWITPKTNWASSDYINASDYNRIKNNALELYNMAVYPQTVYTTITTNPLYYGGGILIATSHIPSEYAGLMTCDWTSSVDSSHTYNGEATVYGGDEDQYLFSDNAYAHQEAGSGTIYAWWYLRVLNKPFEMANMGNDKTATDLPYADEWNTIIDNLELMCDAIGEPWLDAPLYSDNGYYPTGEELNGIEEIEQLLYNRINGT